MSFNPQAVRTILFDLDGTLADTDDAYIERAAKMLGPLKMLFPQHNPRPALRWALTTAISPLNTLMGFPDILHIDDELVKLSNWLADKMDLQTKGHFVLMAGVESVLQQLSQKYTLGIVTARPERGTHAFLDQFNLQQYFQVVAHAQTATHTKPYPDPIFWCAEKLGVQSTECVIVGDTSVDVLCGQRAGAQTIGVLCGFSTRPQLQAYNADLIIEHTADLARVFSVHG
ncbi:MAG: HAD family hydrolase [Anaerolineales bacterium]|nr:HAD family hydrolase [Anaerolineales bacterium]